MSSFGIGGTNAHVVLEEAPAPHALGAARPCQLLVLSARNRPALDSATANLVRHLHQHPDLNLADVAFTLANGRRALGQRRMLVSRTLDEAVQAMGGAVDPQAPKVFTSPTEAAECSVVFMFPGQGSQYVNMCEELYRGEPVFRDHVDRCAEILEPHLDLDLRDVLYPVEARARSAAERLNQTAIAQPALFAVEYALAQLWMSWGVRPQALIGHSIGEYVAACLSGVLTLEDALALVAQRAGIMQRMPAGGMLAVPLPEQDVQGLLGPSLSLAAINGPSLCVVSGPREAVDDLANRLRAEGVACHGLPTSHAFHSAMMEPAIEPFRAGSRRWSSVNSRSPGYPT